MGLMESPVQEVPKQVTPGARRTNWAPLCVGFGLSTPIYIREQLPKTARQLCFRKLLVKEQVPFYLLVSFLAMLEKALSLDCFIFPAQTVTRQSRCMWQNLLGARVGERLRKAFCFGCFVPASLWPFSLKQSLPAGHPYFKYN